MQLLYKMCYQGAKLGLRREKMSHTLSRLEIIYYCYSINFTYPMLINKKISSSIEDQRVQMFRIKYQRVVVIKTIDFNV